jgi:hypothetical protein
LSSNHVDSAACESVLNFAILRLVTSRLTFYPPGTVVYANEQYVGATIRECGLACQDINDIWITTKYAGGDVLDAVDTSLRRVQFVGDLGGTFISPSLLTGSVLFS